MMMMICLLFATSHTLPPGISEVIKQLSCTQNLHCQDDDVDDGNDDHDNDTDDHDDKDTDADAYAEDADCTDNDADADANDDNDSHADADADYDDDDDADAQVLLLVCATMVPFPADQLKSRFINFCHLFHKIWPEQFYQVIKYHRKKH